MKYTQEEDRVTLEMTRADYNQLLYLLGAAAAGMRRQSERAFWDAIKFANRMNATNPAFTLYEIPEEYR